MITTTVPIAVTAQAAPIVAGRRLIFRRAQEKIDHTWRSAMPVELRWEICWDHIFQAGRDLDRLAAHQASSVYLRIGAE